MENSPLFTWEISMERYSNGNSVTGIPNFLAAGNSTGKVDDSGLRNAGQQQPRPLLAA